MPDIECPVCGNVKVLEAINRTADEFCPTPECDFPLFWAPEALARGGESSTLDISLRRLPGTAGRVDIATIDCPRCLEPNPVANIFCLRCTSLLRPEPEPEILLPPPPEPVEEPVAAKAPIWPWILLAVATIALMVWWAAQVWG